MPILRIIFALILASSSALYAEKTNIPWLVSIADTGSMEPVLTGGDLYVMMPVKWVDVREGMIVVFKCDWAKTWVVHRVMSKSRWRAITKGDANQARDPGYLRPENLIGLLTTKIANVKTLTSATSK